MSKKLLIIPNSDVGKLLHISQCFFTAHNVDALLHNEFRQHIDEGLTCDKVALWLTEPSQRLMYSYLGTHKKLPATKISFKEYYRAPERVNFYSRLLGKYSVHEFGYIGVQNYFYQSILLFADWQNVGLYRLPYGSDCQKSVCFDIPAEEYAEIKTLYADDYAIYEQAKAECLRRWENYVSNNKIHINQGKRVIIHLGPPKTGTSAIQSWLNGNVDALRRDGIYYPAHGADANGVSSGNFERVVGYDAQEHKFYFDKVKTKALIEEFNATECHTLLLSSEHFYYYLIWFFSLLSTAKYVFYIRHPLAITESSFHQEVKRHSRTKDFTVPPTIGFDNLKLVSQLSADFDCDVEYRFFSHNLYKGGSLLSDFAACIGTTIQAPKDIKRLNSQYSPGAITLMRMCNSFADQQLKRALDVHLQKHSEDVPAFSFVSDEQRITVLKNIRDEMDKLVLMYPGIDKKRLERLVDGYELPQQFDAKMRDKALTNTLAELIEQDEMLALSLYKQARYQPGNANAKEIISRLKLSNAIKIKFKFYIMIDVLRVTLITKLIKLFK
ncbi:hypothetical protein [Alteromonas gilva]|uniref:Sulfotransferase family protein n=1 Tax=Alteromonas gilva TaxID=2987522 RepID=A0ABT5L7Z2_9ALTE|nr:hypothetical protein [Alteromonas gilva]MDC8833023.1 hypothetical protein [Alteromonas gilva]